MKVAMPFHSTRDRLAVVAAVAAPLAVSAILVPFRTHVPSASMALILVVVVVAVAVMGNRFAGAFAALSSAAWFDFFLTRPYEAFAISKSTDIATAALLLAVGLAVSQLAARARRLQVIAVTDAGYLDRIHRTAQVALSATSPNAVADHVREQLIGLLQLKGCRFEEGSLLGHPPRLEQDGTVVKGLTRWDVERFGLPDDEVELRTFANGLYFGRFMLEPTPGAVPSLQARLVAVTLADQVGAAFEASRASGKRY